MPRQRGRGLGKEKGKDNEWMTEWPVSGCCLSVKARSDQAEDGGQIITCREIASASQPDRASC